MTAKKKQEDSEPTQPAEAAADEELDAAGEEDLLGRKVRGAAGKVARGLSTTASSAVKRALDSRQHVIMVRVNDESLERINDLREAGLFRSRSEAAAYLIAEGIEARSELFSRIRAKIEEIQRIREDLQSLAGEGDDPDAEATP